MTFLTTHDFELCRSQNVECLNYHFDEFYENNHICFDYLIKEGQSQSTNGQFLLKQLTKHWRIYQLKVKRQKNELKKGHFIVDNN